MNNKKKGIPVHAEDADGFQEYVYKNGLTVPAGTLIGHERKDKNGEWQLYLLPNIDFSPEPRR